MWHAHHVYFLLWRRSYHPRSGYIRWHLPIAMVSIRCGIQTHCANNDATGRVAILFFQRIQSDKLFARHIRQCECLIIIRVSWFSGFVCVLWGMAKIGSVLLFFFTDYSENSLCGCYATKHIKLDTIKIDIIQTSLQCDWNTGYRCCVWFKIQSRKIGKKCCWKFWYFYGHLGKGTFNQLMEKIHSY